MKLTLEDCQIDLDTRVVLRGEDRIRLTGTEVELLRFLVSHPGEVLSREEIYKEVWKHQAELQTRTLDLAVFRLRKKIERDSRDPTHILTVYGNGYTFVPLGEKAGPLIPPEAKQEAGRIGREQNAFFGREEEQAHLDRLVGKDLELVTVLGPPGTGKTRLVKHWATKQRESGHFKQVFFCDLIEARSETGTLHAVAAGLHFTLPGQNTDSEELAKRLAESLSKLGQVLVVVDNAEQVVEFVVPIMHRLWKDAKNAAYLVTSQVPLGLPMEKRLPLMPLPMPSLEGDEAFLNNPAVQLFVDRAQSLRPDFKVDENNKEDISKILKDLDGLPLAIELAAARTHLMPVSELRERISDRFRLLRRPKNAGDTRHETLLTALDWSWNLLNPWQKAALAQCSLFHGGFDWNAVEAVIELEASEEAPWVVDVVAELVERSLVSVAENQGSGSRLSLLVSVAEYASKRLEEQGPDSVEAAQKRHASHYASLGGPSGLQRAGGFDAWRIKHYPELENLVIATQNAIERRWPELAAICCESSIFILELRGAYFKGLTLTEGVLALDCEPYNQAGVWHVKGWLSLCTGQPDQALESFQAALNIYRDLGDRRQEARNIDAMASTLLRLGRFDEALSCSLKAMAVSRGCGSTNQEAIVCANLGNIFRAMENTVDARAAYTRTRTLFRELGMTRLLGIATANIGALHADLGEIEEAIAAYKEALEITHSARQQAFEAEAVGALAVLYAQSGEISEAYSLMEKATSLLEAMDSEEMEIRFLCRRGHIAHAEGDNKDAERFLKEAETLAAERSISKFDTDWRELRRLRALLS